MDIISIRRPDDTDMELAEQIADMHNDWAQPLCYVCAISPKGRLDCLGIFGPVSKGMGYLWTKKKALRTYVHEF